MECGEAGEVEVEIARRVASLYTNFRLSFPTKKGMFLRPITAFHGTAGWRKLAVASPHLEAFDFFRAVRLERYIPNRSR